MDNIKSKIECIEKIQKEKYELQAKLNEADSRLKTIIDEVCLYKTEEAKKLKNNKFHNFFNTFFSHLRNLNSSLAFFGICMTSVIFMVVKKDLNNIFLLIGFLLALAPVLFAFFDVFLSISKIKSRIIQTMVVICPAIVYVVVIIFMIIASYNSADVVDRILDISK